MNNVREIVTKAIISKGKKNIKINEKVLISEDIQSVLGCWIINHSFRVENDIKNKVIVKGDFELDIWHSAEGDTKTDVIRKEASYQEKIITKELVKDYIIKEDEPIARIIQEPTCVNAKIHEDHIEIEIILEILVEVIGETKVAINVFDKEDFWDDNLENEITEDFLEE